MWGAARLRRRSRQALPSESTIKLGGGPPLHAAVPAAAPSATWGAAWGAACAPAACVLMQIEDALADGPWLPKEWGRRGLRWGQEPSAGDWGCGFPNS